MRDYETKAFLATRYNIVHECKIARAIRKEDEWLWIPTYFIVVKLNEGKVCTGSGTHMIWGSMDGEKFQPNVGERLLVEELLRQLKERRKLNGEMK